MLFDHLDIQIDINHFNLKIKLDKLCNKLNLSINHMEINNLHKIEMFNLDMYKVDNPMVKCNSLNFNNNLMHKLYNYQLQNHIIDMVIYIINKH